MLEKEKEELPIKTGESKKSWKKERRTSNKNRRIEKMLEKEKEELPIKTGESKKCWKKERRTSNKNRRIEKMLEKGKEELPIKTGKSEKFCGGKYRICYTVPCEQDLYNCNCFSMHMLARKVIHAMFCCRAMHGQIVTCNFRKAGGSGCQNRNYAILGRQKI